MKEEFSNTSFPTSLARSWLIFSTSGLMYFYQFVLQSLPSVMRDGLVVDFSLSQAGFGGMSSSYYYPYIFLQVPAGLLVVRFGARRLLIAGISLCSVASFLSAYSQEFAWVESARILMGLGAAPAFVCTMALATRWFPPAMLPILVALAEILGMLGPALGQEILGWVVEKAGWRAGMALCGWFGLLLFLMILLFIRNSPGTRHHREVTAPQPSIRGLIRAILSPRLVLSGLVSGMIYSAGLALAMLWGVSFIQEHLGISLAKASFCASFYSWGIILGLPAFGWACGRLSGPLFLLMLGAAFTGVSVALILYAPANYGVSCLGMFSCGFFNASYPLIFVVAASVVPREYSGAAFGFANMISTGVGSLLFQPLIGILMELRGHTVPDADSLSILIWAQGLALLLVIPLMLYSRKERRSQSELAME